MAMKLRLHRSTGILQPHCAECGLTHWVGEICRLHLDHINGVCDDHRLENLRIAVPKLP